MNLGGGWNDHVLEMGGDRCREANAEQLERSNARVRAHSMSIDRRNVGTLQEPHSMRHTWDTSRGAPL